MKLFGYNISRAENFDEAEKNLSFVPKTTEDGSLEIASGGSYGTYVDFEGQSKNEGALITRYRRMAMHAECDLAIQDIVNEAIIVSEDGDIVEINTDRVNFNDRIKKKIQDEFKHILNLLDFNNRAYEIFHRWYVDGRLLHHKVVDVEAPTEGIQEIRYIDPRRIKKIKEHVKKKDPVTGVTLHVKTHEYFMYQPAGAYGQQGQASGNGIQPIGFPIASDAISYIHSGYQDPMNGMILGWLNKAIKPLNMLTTMEDSVVIYRSTRAAERRIFYIDTGNLPKGKAEQHVNNIMNKHRNKTVYDSTTGEVKDTRRYMSMLEDYWFPRREGGRGTEVTTLPAGANLGDIEDVLFFQKKLYKSLSVPVSRMESESTFNIGRGQEISRDEIKFSKFITRLRAQFAELFDDLLRTQLILKGVINESEWSEIKQELSYDFQNDSHYAELKNAEIWRERLGLLNEVDPFVGKYFSSEWVKKYVLKFSEEDIMLINSEMDEDGDDFVDDNEAPTSPPGDEMGNPGEQNDLNPNAGVPADPPSLKPAKEEVELAPQETALLESLTSYVDGLNNEDNGS